MRLTTSTINIEEVESVQMKTQNRLSDEMLQFLYQSKTFQSFTEQQQREFLKKYNEHEGFQEILQVALNLHEMIEEVEQMVVPLDEETKSFFATPRHSISTRVTIEDNIYHYPFGEQIKEQGPLIVCLQQGDTMEAVFNFCKGMMMPLFDVCLRQKRDLYIITFGGDDVICHTFPYAAVPLAQFDAWVNTAITGKACLSKALHVASEVYQLADETYNSELMIVTNNMLDDYNDETYKATLQQLIDKNVTISCVAMSEQLYDEQPLTFLNKIYYVH